MSVPQTQIKGSVVLASDAGATTTIGNATGTTAIIGSQVNLTNPRINQPITVAYATIEPPIGSAGLSQIGGKDVYRNNAGGNGFFTTTGTTRQVYAFFNDMPTGRYIVSGVLVMNTNVVATSIEMRTVYNSNTSPSFPQPLTLNQSLTLANTTAENAIELSATKPNTTNKFSIEQTVVIDVSSAIGNQLGLALTFGTATVGASNSFSLYLNFVVVRIG